MHCTKCIISLMQTVGYMQSSISTCSECMTILIYYLMELARLDFFRVHCAVCHMCHCKYWLFSTRSELFRLQSILRNLPTNKGPLSGQIGDNVWWIDWQLLSLLWIII